MESGSEADAGTCVADTAAAILQERLTAATTRGSRTVGIAVDATLRIGPRMPNT